MDTYELVKQASALAKLKKYDEAINLLNELRVEHQISCSEKIIPYYQKAGRYNELEKYCIETLIPMDSRVAKNTFSHKCKELQHAFVNLSVYKIYMKLALCAKREKNGFDELRFLSEASLYYEQYETSLAVGEKVELDTEFIEAKKLWGVEYSEWPESYKDKFSDYISNV
ncbi:hypothetical protein [Agarivorans sp. JK6]|uniref:hypothetical protein n=1 Tax=Agarivorans sp. JK6 TaxID=2997426 RepID=UPI0038736143